MKMQTQPSMTPLELAQHYVGQGWREAKNPYIADIEDLAENRRPQHRYRCSGSSTIAALGKVKCSNGSFQYKAYCQECGGKGTNFPYADIDGLDEDRIPILTDHDIAPCERCGSKDGSEVHHWAPAHLFDDYFEWPTSNLCKSCHAQWHRVITPKMSTTRRES